MTQFSLVVRTASSTRIQSTFLAVLAKQTASALLTVQGNIACLPQVCNRPSSVEIPCQADDQPTHGIHATTPQAEGSSQLTEAAATQLVIRVQPMVQQVP
jgi:hypothetical protein